MTDDKEMRQVLAQALVEAAKKDDRIVVLDADLMSCHATKCFKEAFPERFINVGIAEQNMMGIAAGLASMGKLPVAYSFAPFATRRCYDQIFISIAYAGLKAIIVGTEPGVAAEANGGTHMPFEDMALMRAIPGMMCFEPTDATQLAAAIPELLKAPTPVYIRLFRKKADKVYQDGYFNNAPYLPAKAYRLREGKDVSLVASGIMVSRALEAAEILKGRGIDARVINVSSWKPLDKHELGVAAMDTGAIVTCENHNIHGGLGSAVAEYISGEYPVPIKMVGIQDQFGQVGKNAYLSEVYGITVDDIVSAAQEVIEKKNRMK